MEPRMLLATAWKELWDCARMIGSVHLVEGRGGEYTPAKDPGLVETSHERVVILHRPLHSADGIGRSVGSHRNLASRWRSSVWQQSFSSAFPQSDRVCPTR